jgi:hypothetical protein
MKTYTRPFISPLSTEREDNVRHVGTGSFLNWAGKTLLLTCEHVGAEGQINFSFLGSDSVLATTRPFKSDRALDAAFVAVSDEQWNAFPHHAMPIPSACVGGQHKPTRREELHFFHGFAGENSRYGSGVLDSSASAFVTQQSADAVEDERIFELLWEPEGITFVESTSIEVRKSVRYTDPGGFSGSLVWNTHYLEVTSTGHQWTPECAVVTGLLKRWDTGTKTLLVTRIEHLRRYLDAEV